MCVVFAQECRCPSLWTEWWGRPTSGCHVGEHSSAWIVLYKNVKKKKKFCVMIEPGGKTAGEEDTATQLGDLGAALSHANSTSIHGLYV